MSFGERLGQFFIIRANNTTYFLVGSVPFFLVQAVLLLKIGIKIQNQPYRFFCEIFKRQGTVRFPSQQKTAKHPTHLQVLLPPQGAVQLCFAHNCPKSNGTSTNWRVRVLARSADTYCESLHVFRSFTMHTPKSSTISAPCVDIVYNSSGHHLILI